MPNSRALRLAFALTLAIACKEAEAPEPEIVRPIKILEIGDTGGSGRREFPGTISAATSAELAFEVPGKLTEFPIHEGEEVEAGSVLARIDPRDYENRLAKARAQRNDARTEFERAKKLFEQGVSAEAERDRRQRTLEVAEADLDEARKAVEDTILRAPFAGTVARKLVHDFENVQAKQPVVLLEDDTSLEIVVDIPERDIAQGGNPRADDAELSRLLGPEVSLTALPDRRFPARVKEFSTAADPDTRTFRGTLAFDPPSDTRVLPGMTAKVSIRPPRSFAPDAALEVPARAVRADDAGASFVWIVDPSTMVVSPRSVSLGALVEDRVQVISGLRSGDWLAVSGVHQLREGMQVSRMGD